MFIYYCVFPFILFVFVHWFYIWFGRLVTEPYSKGVKISFWIAYAAFGIIFIYTNLIWSVEIVAGKHSSTEDDKSRYMRYDKYYSSLNNKYKKVNIAGIIDPQINIEFVATLLNNKEGCSTQHTISRHGDDWYTNEERIIYPRLRPGPFNIDIYLENYIEETNCKFSLKDGIDVYVFGDNQKHHFHHAKIYRQPDNYTDPSIISNEAAVILCKEGSIGRKAVTKCKNINSTSSALYALGKTNAIHLDLKTKGVISGNTLFFQNKGSSDFVSDAFSIAFRKFAICDIPSFDPR